MGNRQRLADLEDLLELEYEKLGEFQRELSLNASISVAEKVELKRRIKREILPNIRSYEQEYWELYPIEEVVIDEQEAEAQLVQVKKAVASLERIPTTEYPPEMFELLQEIRAKLEDMSKPASVKFKLVLPLIPGLAFGELHMDNKEVMYKTWERIRGGLKKLNPNFFRS